MKVANTAASIVLALLFSLSAALGIAAVSDSPPSLMSRADYTAALRGVRDDGRVALAQCRTLEGAHERAICRAEARAAERVAAATLDARYRGTVAAQERARKIQDRAEYSVDLVRRLLPT